MEMTANTCLSIVLNPLSPPLVFNKLNPLVIFISDAVACTLYRTACPQDGLINVTKNQF